MFEAVEMIISVTNTIVKIGRRNNISKRNSLSVVAEDDLYDGNDHFVDKEDFRSGESDGHLTRTGIMMMEMIFSAAEKIMSAAEAISDVAKTMAFMTQTIITEAKKMLFVPPRYIYFNYLPDRQEIGNLIFKIGRSK
jgi:hypothetical protein